MTAHAFTAPVPAAGATHTNAAEVLSLFVTCVTPPGHERWRRDVPSVPREVVPAFAPEKLVGEPENTAASQPRNICTRARVSRKLHCDTMRYGATLLRF